MPIDLHAHTTASDGSFSPTELVAHAHELGLKALAITDHDSFNGWDEAQIAGERLGVEIVPGIELSVSDESGKFHLLGYYVNRDSQLSRELEGIQWERDNRNHLIVDKLNTLPEVQNKGGVSWELVRSFVDENTQIGRPHLAQALMKIGVVSSVQQAFDEYLADGKKAHASKRVLTPQRAVELIHDAGGVAIWAHPTRPPSERSSAFDLSRGDELLKLWLAWGLDGLETFYGAYTPEEVAWTMARAREHGLVGTGGSDFHGATKPNVLLGKVNGGASVPDDVLRALKARAGV